jgi:adenylate cyclase
MARDDVKRKLTAIFSADVVGYSRLMGEDELATIQTLTSHQQTMGNLIRHYRGRVVDYVGDNLMAEFASVVDAVQCAVEVQRVLSSKNEALPENRRMHFRIGINLGDVIEEGERIYGDGVNIAARIESLASAGGICISGSAFEQIDNKLALGYEYMGEHIVKNIAKPVKVYKVPTGPLAEKEKKIAITGWHKATVGAVAIFIIGVALWALWNYYWRPTHPPIEVASVEKMAFALPDKPSIAVLPFVNVGGDQKQEYFSDGITDDLITDLSKVSGLFVIARNSVFTYKGKAVKVQQVAQELGVRYVLEGSVRRAGEQVRINAQLVDATTGHHLWAERYDGDMSNVFGLQDKITGEIVAALAVKLTSGEKEQVERKYTHNTAAYDVFLQGRAHYFRRTPQDWAKAVSYFEKAVELDPSYGRAYAALALTYWESSHNLWTFNLGVSWKEARDRAERYLKLAMGNVSPLARQVASKMLIDWHRHENAIAEAQRAIALDPNDADSYLAVAYALIYAGRPKEAVDFVQRAMRLDPHYPAYHLYVLGLAHFVMEEFDAAVPLFERALKLNPENYVPLIPLAAAHAHLGHKQKAAATVEELQKALPSIFTLSLLSRHPLLSYKDPADRDRLLEGLRQAGVPETPYDALRNAS